MEHDRRKIIIWGCLHEAGVTLNRMKTVIGTTQLKYLGQSFASKGVSVDPAKKKAVSKMRAPQNPAEVRSVLGMINN